MKLLVWLALTCVAFSLGRHSAVAAIVAPDSAMAGNSVESSDQESEADARRALGRWFRFPWYDSASDDIKTVAADEEEQKPVEKAPEVSLLRFLAWGAIALILAGLVWPIVLAFLKYADFSTPEVAGPRVATRVDHAEALPFLRQRSLDDLLGQAREHYLAGNYDEAIIYLFSYQLVELDRRSLIRLAKGKTNRQYVRELRERGTLAGLVEQTMVAFEDVYFGGRRLSRQTFDAAWQRLAEFEALVTSFGAESPASSARATEPVSMLAENAAGPN